MSFGIPKCELPMLIIGYWPSLGSQESAIVIEPLSPFASVICALPTTAAFVECLILPIFSRNLAQYGPYTKLIFTFTMASSSESGRARVPPMDGTLLGHMSLLPWQTIYCAENKCWRTEFGPELAAKCILELSFQQRHDIGNRSSTTFLSILGQCWPVSNFALGYFIGAEKVRTSSLTGHIRQKLLK